MMRLEHFVSSVAVELAVTTEALKGPSRDRKLAAQRHEAMRRCRQAGYKIRAIGTFFNRHHAMVCYATNPDKAMTKRANMRKRYDAVR